MLFANGGLMALGTMKTKRAPLRAEMSQQVFFQIRFEILY
jgi:hypothetical protein